ncbi:hypothetical protein GGD65_006154 [Bradyrhizobium sp. CIR18]|uniref:hypothetical protein n=1 Tax=Bradyrhizobium sp. CIR18 TaxID=2663839 RepID=UPI001792147D|nr:hypothetical protein [Bradyrhizobium sp. CIR18]MBB4365090.1 hypothetical protein [Bradyrhizobium sp. CIR18]
MDQGATEHGAPVIGHPRTVARGFMRFRTLCRLLAVVPVGFGLAPLGQALGAAAELGVRHRIDVMVSAEPDAPILSRFKGAKGELSFTVRLSANSKESKFFGMLRPSFPDIVVPDGAGKPLVQQTKLWEEEVCHQRRGLPKVTVTQLGGHFGEGEGRIEISAINRHIGVLVPPDELTPGIKLDPGSDSFGVFLAFRAQTRNSRLNVDLKIYPIDCFL